MVRDYPFICWCTGIGAFRKFEWTHIAITEHLRLFNASASRIVAMPEALESTSVFCLAFPCFYQRIPKALLIITWCAPTTCTAMTAAPIQRSTEQCLCATLLPASDQIVKTRVRFVGLLVDIHFPWTRWKSLSAINIIEGCRLDHVAQGRRRTEWIVPEHIINIREHYIKPGLQYDPDDNIKFVAGYDIEVGRSIPDRMSDLFAAHKNGTLCPPVAINLAV
mmetsp:Transcript_29398/g.80354  ORF Transcript_29398/g.80354 Transcript_29398/m.80354 type:complete len:221 (+) Transcript_29398:187-849(+)